MKTQILASAILTVFGSCSNSTDKHDKFDSTIVSEASQSAFVSDIQPYRPQIDLTPWDGDLLDAVYWKDSLGENALIISGMPQYLWEEQKPELKLKLRQDQDPKKYCNAVEISARHYVLKSGEAKWVLYYEYHNELISQFDVMMAYQKNSLVVTDLDTNGIGEALFLYTEAEGENIRKHDYAGKMILLHDSIARVSVGPIGLAAVNGPAPQSSEEKIHLVTPEMPAFRTFLLNRWDMYYKEQERLDRESITEQNNVDEHGHADHVH